MNRLGFLSACLLPILIACTSTTRPGAVGVTREQILLLSAAEVERMASIQYSEQYQKAKSAGVLIESGPELDRLKRIADRLINQADVFRDDTRRWKWELTLIDAPVLNATCAPGGKITVFTGLIRQLALSDDETATVIGHEIAHALREHGREKASRAMTQQLISEVASAKIKGKDKQILLAKQLAYYILTLPNSRTNETEADKVGLELMSRAGFDPNAAVTFWKKMIDSKKGAAPAEFVSTHPSHATRITDITKLLPTVLALRGNADQAVMRTALSTETPNMKSLEWCPEFDNFCDAKPIDNHPSQSSLKRTGSLQWCPDKDAFCEP